MTLRTAYEREVLGRILDSAMKETDALRRELLASVGGRVAEIGFGTGANLPAYGDAVEEILAIEPSHGLLERAAPAIARSGLRVTPIEASASRPLPIEPASCDAVVITFVLCSVKHVDALLEQATRLLRPGAPLVVVEHVVARGSFVRASQKAIRPLWSALLGGCDPAFDARTAYERAGFDTAPLRDLELPFPFPVKTGLAGRIVRDPSKRS